MQCWVKNEDFLTCLLFVRLPFWKLLKTFSHLYRCHAGNNRLLEIVMVTVVITIGLTFRNCSLYIVEKVD